MGYSIYLIDRNKSITEDVMDEVVKALPKRLQSLFSNIGTSKQNWGWSARTDISLTNNKAINIQYVCVSGSFGGSGTWALDMVIALQQILQKKGYTIEVYSTDYGFINKELYAWMGYDPEELSKEESFL